MSTGLLLTNTKDDGLSSVDDALNVVHDGTAFTTLDMINVLLTLIPDLLSPFAYLWFYREEGNLLETKCRAKTSGHSANDRPHVLCRETCQCFQGSTFIFSTRGIASTATAFCSEFISGLPGLVTKSNCEELSISSCQLFIHHILSP